MPKMSTYADDGGEWRRITDNSGGYGGLSTHLRRCSGGGVLFSRPTLLSLTSRQSFSLPDPRN
ncbi:unnamed protein product [Scytosiphon promiscuus]